jgi:hypothetical protein
MGMNWNRFNMFKLPNRHRRFEYIPRYYDERKETLEKKIRQAEIAKANGEVSDSERAINFREEMRDSWRNSDEIKTQRLRSNIRLIVILGIIIIAFYYLFIGLDVSAEAIDENIDKLR